MTPSKAGRDLARLRWRKEKRMKRVLHRHGKPVRLQLESRGKAIGTVGAVMFDAPGLKRFFAALAH